MSEGTFGNPEIVEYETDILIIGGGMAACGAAFEAKRWAGDDVKITLVDKAAMDRSGAVAQGLSAINTYIGDNSTEDYVRMVHADLMGITRDDLVYDVGRHVDGTVHLFEEWGLPIWKSKETEGMPLAEGGKPVRSGRWQIMINGEGYKTDRRRGGQEGARHGEHLRARVHRETAARREQREPDRRRCRLSRCAKTRSTCSRPRPS